MRQMTVKMQGLEAKAFAVWVETGKVTEAAERVGLPESTVYEWKRRFDWENRQQAIVESVNEAVDERLVGIVSRVAEQVPEMLTKLEEMLDAAEPGNVKDVAMAYKILAETYQLVTGEATSRTESTERSEQTNVAELAEVFRRAHEQSQPVVVEVEGQDREEEREEIQEQLTEAGVVLEEDGVDIDEALEE